MNIGIRVLVISLLLLFFISAFQYMRSGTRSVGVIESIDGIPYPQQDSAFLITEKLAHADVYLRESVFGKELQLTVTFHPGNTSQLAVGVRENSFWLSYPKTILWDGTGTRTEQTKQVSIPLTDKLQESDQSIDVMFFAQTPASTNEVDEGIHDTTTWQLVSVTTDITPTWPTRVEAKDYVKSILNQERAL